MVNFRTINENKPNFFYFITASLDFQPALKENGGKVNDE